MKEIKKPTVLVVLDGLGYSPSTTHNAVFAAKTPNLDSWQDSYPHALLKASGTAVGLLEGAIGNSEVGHLTLGSGRIVQQPVAIVHEAIANKTLFKNSVLIEQLKKIKTSGSKLHLMGLLSDASVHSHIAHLFAFLDAAKQVGLENVFIHPFLDGRDTPPQSAATYLEQLDKKIAQLGLGNIASLHGRFYAMDRDNNWERTEQSYCTLTEKQTTKQTSWQETLDESYKKNITDEFVPPTQLHPSGIIEPGDGILFFNFRPDRARQLTRAFIDPSFIEFKRKRVQLECFITPFSYTPTLKTDVLFSRKPIRNTLCDVLHNNGKTMFAIAETEKYAHVTYFFSGGREQRLANETRMLIPSIRATTYVKHPAMSAQKITEAVLTSLKTDPHDFYLINYANADMVGHSGNMDATVKAIEYLDGQLKKLYDQIITNMDGTLYITSDHGNAEQMFDATTGQPTTAHTTNQVPFIMLKKELRGNTKELPLTELSEIAPFILQNMELEIPKEMTKTLN
ncbi:2,3-bisphosphoglycerate-independent phosphoglycerate mutase [Candidatus Dependentiae bacterium]